MLGMSAYRYNRSMITLALYASLLLSLFACGMHHGHMSGQLASVSGVLCSGASHSIPGVDIDSVGHTQQTASFLNCSLCSSLAVVITASITSWMVALVLGKAVAPPVVTAWIPPPPRYSWSSLNPRASPNTLSAMS
ncbi:DUF2946 family protein [Halopseudomonas pelagia]|uniref:DUF2946 family protein n=1 Tax=Halopseudomonas pelagia TaxID=553151 RepID=UPI0030D9F6A7|tara:strand:- start:316 stop:723 length:408 start_codon:yes stop_codon:yes gene_type:complete